MHLSALNFLVQSKHTVLPSILQCDWLADGLHKIWELMINQASRHLSVAEIQSRIVCIQEL